MRSQTHSAKPSEVEKKWILIDAEGLVLGRMAAIVRLVGERSGWGKRALPRGHGLGLAHWYSHFGYFAEVAEVSVAADGAVKVHKLWMVADVGSPIVNPAGAEQQSTWYRWVELRRAQAVASATHRAIVRCLSPDRTDGQVALGSQHIAHGTPAHGCQRAAR